MTYKKQKVVWVDFFGVICSEVAPFWFRKYFSEEDAIRLKEKYFVPADLGEISNSELITTLSTLVGKTEQEINNEFTSYVKINFKVVGYLRDLKKSHKIILCSNASSDFLRKIIVDNNLEDIFNDIIISSEIKSIKPDIIFFEKCLASSECRKEEVVFIDDNKINTDAAKTFGVKTILFAENKDLLLSKLNE